jgi:hypothetical protein
MEKIPRGTASNAFGTTDVCCGSSIARAGDVLVGVAGVLAYGTGKGIWAIIYLADAVEILRDDAKVRWAIGVAAVFDRAFAVIDVTIPSAPTGEGPIQFLTHVSNKQASITACVLDIGEIHSGTLLRVVKIHVAV